MRHRNLGFAGILAVLLAALTVVTTQVKADDPNEKAPASDHRPAVKPGWPSTGSMRISGCVANEDNPVCEVTEEGPFGPITVITEYIPPKVGVAAPGKLYKFDNYSTCHVTWRGGYPSFWYEIWTPWSYNYSTVTGMSPTYYSDHSFPFWGWDDHQTYNDWASGWQYAWGNGRADLTYGWPVSVEVASVV